MKKLNFLVNLLCVAIAVFCFFQDAQAGAIFAIAPFRPKGMFIPQGQAGMVTPQQKLIHVANQSGNPALANQQGTDRIIYDTLPLDNRTEYIFFEGASARDFPFTNVNSGSGKLSVGEGMIVNYAQLTFFVRDPATGAITTFLPLSTQFNFLGGELSFLTAEKQVFKRLPLQNFAAQYNKDGDMPDYNVFRFNSLVSIQSLVEFSARVRPTAGVTLPNGFVRLTLEGNGSLLSPQNPQ